MLIICPFPYIFHHSGIVWGFQVADYAGFFVRCIADFCSRSTSNAMKLIKPTEISAQILTLLDESTERVVIVSPYIKMSNWHKLSKRICALSSRGIDLDIYVRDAQNYVDTFRDLDDLGLRYTKVPYLHGKYYLNESYGIVTSMNLLLSSEINALEIGHRTDSDAEYNSLCNFHYRYVQKAAHVTHDQAPAVPPIVQAIKEDLYTHAKVAWLKFEGNSIRLSTGTADYTISILEQRLQISVQVPAQKAEAMKKIQELTAMKICTTGGANHRISGQSYFALNSKGLGRVSKKEAPLIQAFVRRFVLALEDVLAQVNVR